MASEQNISTTYSQYSDVALYSNFRSDEWYRYDGPYMTMDQRMADRQQLLQELNNRASRDYGSKPVPVNAATISGYGSYSQRTGSITISESLVKDGYVTTKEGKFVGVENSNFRSMANIYHESWHAAQHQARTDPTIYIGDEKTRMDVIANLSNYIQSSSDHDLYRIQITEKQANEYAEKKTMDALRSTEAFYGKDMYLDNFKGSLTKSYDDALARAQTVYNDPNIAQTLQTAINDVHYGNGMIRENMTYSYYQVRSILINQEISRLQNATNPADHKDAIKALENLKSDIQSASMRSTVVQSEFNAANAAMNSAAKGSVPNNTPSTTAKTSTPETNNDLKSATCVMPDADTSISRTDVLTALGVETGSTTESTVGSTVSSTTDTETAAESSDVRSDAGSSGPSNDSNNDGGNDNDNGMEM